MHCARLAVQVHSWFARKECQCGREGERKSSWRLLEDAAACVLLSPLRSWGHAGRVSGRSSSRPSWSAAARSHRSAVIAASQRASSSARLAHSPTMRGRLLTLDALSSATVGLFLFFAPHIVADFLFKQRSDGVHWHLVRCVGGQLLAGAFVSYRFRNSNPTAHTVCHLLRIIPCLICLMLVFQCRSMTPHLIEPTYLEYAKNSLMFGLVFNAVLLASSGWHIGTTLVPGNRIGNCLYQLDALASICIGIAWLTFPKWLLHKQVVVPLDESHELCGRVMGALFVTSYAVSAHALHWTDNSQKMMAVDSRVVCCVFILSAQVWSQVAYLDSWSGGHWVGISLFSTWTVVSIIYRLTLYCAAKSKKM